MQREDSTLYTIFKTKKRQHGCSDHLVDLFQVFPGSTPQLHLYLANWSASCQLVFLTCSVYLLYFQTHNVN